MKDSIGSTLLLEIFFVFFVIIISFMAVVINYAKVFTIKNDLITIIERNQGYETTSVQNQIDEYLDDKHYSSDGNSLVIERKNIPSETGYYYTITVYSTFKVPLIRQSIKIPVKGNTKNIVKIKEKMEDVNYKEIDSDLNS